MQNAIDIRGLPIIITGVALQKPNKYILNYVSNESRDDSSEYGKLIEKLNKKEIGKFYLNHIKNINGYYATIAEDAIAMKHKVKMLVETQKKGLLGRKTVREYKTVKVDGKTYRQMKKQMRNKPFSLDEMIFYDTIFED